VTRFRKINRYLLLLAALFVLAVLRDTDMPGEEVLPDVYRATLHRPLLAQAAQAAHQDEIDLVKLRSDLEVARREVRQLKEQLERTHQLRDYFKALVWRARPQAVPGWVFGVDTDVYRRHFFIDRGRNDGIEVGMPVVTGTALLGLTIRINARTATVRRLDDPAFRIEVEIETEQGVVHGVARGDGDGGLDVRFVRSAESLRAGDSAFTSRYDEKVPPGLFIGRVERVDDVDRDGVHEVTVTPAAALGRWAQIHVLKKKQVE
jgi:cell shape-determining protein MreC